jgi:tRNA threonylcarbamoyladenosine biosynthesis protein TsaB
VKVLAIETATVVCAAAVVDGNLVLAERSISERHAHAERIMDLADQCLTLAGGISSLEGIAVSSGPGSFTGLRIGMSVAKGLSFAAGIPVVGVPTMEALRRRALDAGSKFAGDVVAVLNARRGEYFAQASHDAEVSVLKAEAFAKRYPVGAFMLTGETDALLSELGAGTGYRVVEHPFNACSAAVVGLLGASLLEAGKGMGPAGIEPEYALDFLFTPHNPGRS